jgi:hypothetical protein
MDSTIVNSQKFTNFESVTKNTTTYFVPTKTVSPRGRPGGDTLAKQTPTEDIDQLNPF